MPSSIETLFAEVQLAYLPVAQGDAVCWAFGASQIHSNDGPPRIVCVHQSSVFEPLDQSATVIQPTGQQAFYLRRATLVWHVWASDDEVLEALVINLVHALKRVLGESNHVYVPLAEDRVREQLEDISSHGSYSEFTCEVVHRFDDEALDVLLGTPTSQEIANKNFGATSLEYDENEYDPVEYA